jgi:hypothetical protein
MKSIKEEITQICIDLLQEAKNNKQFKENITLSEYEKFDKWIDEIDYETACKILSLNEGKIEDAKKLALRLVQGAGSITSNILQVVTMNTFRTVVLPLMLRYGKHICYKNSGEIKQNAQNCILHKTQRCIGVVKKAKTECKNSKNPRTCEKQLDKLIQNLANRVTKLSAQMRAK